MSFKEVPLCPECKHGTHLHRFEYPEAEEKGFKCRERMSYDNNDFCGCRHGAPPEPTYTFYAIADNKNVKKAQWYCTYSARKSSGWKKDFADAKIWTKRASAKSKATALGGGAYIVEFEVTKIVVIDQVEHLKKVMQERVQREEKRLRAEHESAVKRAKDDLDRAIARLKTLEGKK